MEQVNLGEKTSLREKYEVEVEQIKTRFGTLEQMRAQLGLTKRKMAEYLLVDPSAWTRWTGGEESAPLHVYKTMSFLMAQHEAQPKINDLQFSKPSQKDAGVDMAWANAIKASFDDELQRLQSLFLTQIEVLKKQSEKSETLTLGWKFLLVINTVLILYVLIR